MRGQQGRITIIDIAEECGCSKTTVACAMDERTAHKVAQKTREKIYEAVRRLGYLPNRSAKALRLRRTYTIGIMLPMWRPFSGRSTCCCRAGLTESSPGSFQAFTLRNAAFP